MNITAGVDTRTKIEMCSGQFLTRLFMSTLSTKKRGRSKKNLPSKRQRDKHLQCTFPKKRKKKVRERREFIEAHMRELDKCTSHVE